MPQSYDGNPWPEFNEITWESFVRTLQDNRWVAQGFDHENGDPGRWVQPTLWWADGVVAEFGDTRPWVYSDES